MQQRSMFESEDSQPLAARMRPRTLDEFAGRTCWAKARCCGG